LTTIYENHGKKKIIPAISGYWLSVFCNPVFHFFSVPSSSTESWVGRDSDCSWKILSTYNPWLDWRAA